MLHVFFTLPFLRKSSFQSAEEAVRTSHLSRLRAEVGLSGPGEGFLQSQTF